MTATLRPQHFSLRDKPVRPRNMTRIKLKFEQREALEELCLGVFADMVNSGATLAATLTAIYLTGVQNTLAASSENP